MSKEGPIGTEKNMQESALSAGALLVAALEIDVHRSKHAWLQQASFGKGPLHSGSKVLNECIFQLVVLK